MPAAPTITTDAAKAPNETQDWSHVSAGRREPFALRQTSAPPDTEFHGSHGKLPGAATTARVLLRAMRSPRKRKAHPGPDAVPPSAPASVQKRIFSTHP